ncbi:MAG: 5'-methylthioadenosine/adenosylhomocysteine nucleosidase [Aquabacterium sp.]|uniref:5'-methylthioadenosine/adenosylhomocysteine nucleosidase n=1 Tax=Aquabacterium sp. G14 TaxID=3130164 RepID=UPI0011D49D6A|nr:MAG: 5'-methylthioadenosine/adenosylhomocysteine nucleosidase [Aquabacterium sp.]
MLSTPGRIGVIAALPEELQSLLDAMPDAQAIERAGRTFWVGHLQGRDIVAVLSRIGKVAAATTTTVLLTEMACRQIIFTGVAGGLGPDVRVGDVVVADALVQHDMDASPLFPRYELPGLGVSHLHPPVDLTARVHEVVSEALSPQALSVNGPLKDVHLASLGLGLPRVHRGLIASGDQFVNAAADCDTLRHHLPGVLAVEMEGAAVAQVCHDFDTPYVVLRTISDRADESAHIDFPRFVRAVACRYALVMIEALLRPDRGS